MKFTVDVEDFYLEEADLSEGLKSAIKSDVIQAINERVKKQVDNLTNNLLVGNIEKEIEVRVKVLVDDFLATGKVFKDMYSKTDLISVKDWIAMHLKVQSSSIESYIKKSIEAMGVELKNRYDIMFASQIISKINQQGFLKEDIAKMLLEEQK